VRVSVVTPAPTSPKDRVAVKIEGRWANPRVLQIKGRPGRHELRVLATRGNEVDERKIDVELVAGRDERAFAEFYVGANPHRKMSAAFRIFDEPRRTQKSAGPDLPSPRYEWDFGDGTRAVTTKPYVTHDYDRAMSTEDDSKAFEVSVRSSELDQAGTKTVTVWNMERVKLPYTVDSEAVAPGRTFFEAAAAGRERTALVLSGGGSKGAFQAGVVSYLYDELGFRPQVIAGTSVGSLNAAKLAEGEVVRDGSVVHAAQRLRELWSGIDGNDDVFSKSDDLRALEDEYEDIDQSIGAWDIAFFLTTGPIGIAAYGVENLLDIKETVDVLSRVDYLYVQDGLQRMVESRLDPGLVSDSGIILRLGSVDIGNGELRFFTETGAVLDRSLNEIARAGSAPLRDAVLASSAIPAAFKSVSIGGRSYVDGAIREDVPLRAALDLNPARVVVVNTFPTQFEAAGLVPLGDLPAPKALETFLRSVEVMADEVALDDFESQRAMNWTLREVFTPRDPDNPLLTLPAGPEGEPVIGRRLLTYPLGHQVQREPLRVDYVVPRIQVFSPPWSPSREVIDFDRGVIHASLALGRKMAELQTTEIPGGFSLRSEACTFVRDREERSRPLGSETHYQHGAWSDWLYNECGGLRVPCVPAGSDECTAEQAKQYEEEYEREAERRYWESYCKDADGHDWCEEQSQGSEG
jgi:NTE family protein